MGYHASHGEQAVRKTIETARKTVVEYCQSNGLSAEETMHSLRRLNKNRDVLKKLGDKEGCEAHDGCIDAVVIHLPRRH